MTPDTKLALDLIARTKAILNSIPDDERALGEAYAALEAADSMHWKVDTSDGVELHSSRLAAVWHAFHDGNGYVFAWRNSCETLEMDLRWLKRILHGCMGFQAQTIINHIENEQRRAEKSNRTARKVAIK